MYSIVCVIFSTTNSISALSLVLNREVDSRDWLTVLMTCSSVENTRDTDLNDSSVLISCFSLVSIAWLSVFHPLNVIEKNWEGLIKYKTDIILFFLCFFSIFISLNLNKPIQFIEKLELDKLLNNLIFRQAVVFVSLNKDLIWQLRLKFIQ